MYFLRCNYLDMKTNSQLDPKILDISVTNELGENRPFGEYLDRETLIVFLRHFACIGCAAHMVELPPRFHEFIEKGFNIVLVGNGSPYFIDKFKNRFNLKDKKIHIVTDPTLTIYQSFKLKNSLWGGLGIPAIINFAKYFSQGLMQTSIEGSVAQQGGTVLLDHNKSICFCH